MVSLYSQTLSRVFSTGVQSPGEESNGESVNPTGGLNEKGFSNVAHDHGAGLNEKYFLRQKTLNVIAECKNHLNRSVWYDSLFFQGWDFVLLLGSNSI